MSRPPNQQYPMNNVLNGGLIDFRDNQPMYTEQAYPTPMGPAVANLAAYTTPANYPQYQAAYSTMNQPMYPPTNPAMPTPNMMYTNAAPVQYANPAMPPVYNNLAQSQVIAGPPSEVYAHGKVYKAVEENMQTTPMSAPASLDNDSLHKDLQLHVAQKVQEYMTKNKNSLGSSAYMQDDLENSDSKFYKEIKRLNANMSKRR